MKKTDKKYIAVIVLYKETFTTANTIKSIINYCQETYAKIHFVIWDNSPTEMPKNEFELISCLEYEYLHTPENIPLSKIYNNVAKAYTNKELLFLFDQDSNLTDCYFKKCIEASNINTSICLFVPYIKHNDIIVSPGWFVIYRGVYWKRLKLGVIPSKNVTVVTSGMCIRFSCLNSDLSFDEHLSLYGIDTKFCLDYSKRNKFLYVLDYEMGHNLSQFNVESSLVKKKRLWSTCISQRYVAKSISLFAYLCSIFETRIKQFLFMLTHK